MICVSNLFESLRKYLPIHWCIWDARRYRKIPKISHGLIFFKGPFWGLIFGGAFIRLGLSKEANLRFIIDWVSLIVGSKFTVFALFYFIFEGKFPSTSPRGAYIWRGDLTEGFLRYWIGGDLYFEGLMKTLVFGNLFKPFRLAITFAREVYHLGIKMKTNMTIAFFSLSPTANCPYECDGKS